jgi:C-terminal processing protease CtpA/Prc
MKKAILILTCSMFSNFTFSQTGTNPIFNFGFEKNSTKGQLPDYWYKMGTDDYKLSVDSIEKHSGKVSLSIELAGSKTAAAFGAIGYSIPAIYKGDNIELRAYMKLKNVENGRIGLMLRIDGSGGSLKFDNMMQKNISGTSDWTQYTVTLPLPAESKKIVIGPILSGSGKIWIDDVQLLIDGKDISVAEIRNYKADKDIEFDKGSGITRLSIDKNQIENLKTLGLIWGFLKYYHPNIAKGEYNWDYELFRILPKILNSNNQKNRDSVLIKWVDSFGEFSQHKENVIQSSEVKIEPDIDWIKNSNFSDELTTLLIKVKNANRPKEHYYIGLNRNVGNPDFKNENSYSSMKYPDAGFRLLTLYRYWNIIQYYFPYKNLIDGDWKNVLNEFIPIFINAKDETEYTLAVLELIGQVNDTHANIWGGNLVLNNYLGLRTASVKLTFIENRPVVTGFYDKKLGKETGLEIGDIISLINNRPVEEIVKEKLKYSPASNYPTKLRDISSNLLRTNDTTINIEYIRVDKRESKSLKTFSLKDINIYSKYQVADTCFKLINKDIAYINNGSLKREYLPKIWKEIENTKGLIIDNRNYPSDFPIYDLSSYLMPRSTPFFKSTNGSIESPGLFTFVKTLNAGKKNTSYYKGKVIILINEISQSSAEFHTMAYRVNPNSKVIGSTTAGADGNVSEFYLPGGISTMISGIGVYYPDGKETQRIGIVPDIEIKPTIRGIKEGRDELLEKAIGIINGQ